MSSSIIKSKKFPSNFFLLASKLQNIHVVSCYRNNFLDQCEHNSTSENFLIHSCAIDRSFQFFLKLDDKNETTRENRYQVML